MAWLVRKPARPRCIENVFRVSALSVFLMFLVTSRFFPRAGTRSGEQKVASIAEAIKNMFVVLGNFRFVLFLLVIFSSFYIVFWQEFISAAAFLRGYVDANATYRPRCSSMDALTVICFQILRHSPDEKNACLPGDDVGLFDHQCLLGSS